MRILPGNGTIVRQRVQAYTKVYGIGRKAHQLQTPKGYPDISPSLASAALVGSTHLTFSLFRVLMRQTTCSRTCFLV